MRKKKRRKKKIRVVTMGEIYHRKEEKERIYRGCYCGRNK
jgi:hypothetical protein